MREDFSSARAKRPEIAAVLRAAQTQRVTLAEQSGLKIRATLIDSAACVFVVKHMPRSKVPRDPSAVTGLLGFLMAAEETPGTVEESSIFGG